MKQTEETNPEPKYKQRARTSLKNWPEIEVCPQLFSTNYNDQKAIEQETHQEDERTWKDFCETLQLDRKSEQRT